MVPVVHGEKKRGTSSDAGGMGSNVLMKNSNEKKGYYNSKITIEPEMKSNDMCICA